MESSEFPNENEYAYDQSGADHTLLNDNLGEPEDTDHFVQEDFWRIITSFFKDKGLVRQQIDSYNDFIDNSIKQVVREHSKIILQTANHQNTGPNDTLVRLIV